MTNDPVRVYYDADADRGRLAGRRFAIIGYGSQGHAHALNLRDGGASVIVGLRQGGGSWQRAEAAGLDVRPVAAAAAAADVIMMLTPDQDGRAVYESGVAQGLAPGKTLMFAHGFNIHYGEIAPPAGVDVSMVAPKSPGHLVRSEYEAGRGVPGLVAVHQDASGQALANALAYASGIGCTRAGVIETIESGAPLYGPARYIRPTAWNGWLPGPAARPPSPARTAPCSSRPVTCHGSPMRSAPYSPTPRSPSGCAGPPRTAAAPCRTRTTLWPPP